MMNQARALGSAEAAGQAPRNELAGILSRVGDLGERADSVAVQLHGQANRLLGYLPSLDPTSGTAGKLPSCMLDEITQALDRLTTLLIDIQAGADRLSDIG